MIRLTPRVKARFVGKGKASICFAIGSGLNLFLV